MNMEEKIAVKTAGCYWGFSKKAGTFPKTFVVDVISGEGELSPEDRERYSKLSKHWEEAIGSLSKTGRMTPMDVVHFLKKEGVSMNQKEAEAFMERIARSIKGVVLVKVKSGAIVKKLIVNTYITM